MLVPQLSVKAFPEMVTVYRPLPSSFLVQASPAAHLHPANVTFLACKPFPLHPHSGKYIVSFFPFAPYFILKGLEAALKMPHSTNK